MCTLAIQTLSCHCLRHQNLVVMNKFHLLEGGGKKGFVLFRSLNHWERGREPGDYLLVNDENHGDLHPEIRIATQKTTKKRYNA